MPKQKRAKQAGVSVSATSAYLSAAEQDEAEQAVTAALQQTTDAGDSGAGREKATPALLLQQLRDAKPAKREHAAHALSALAENATPTVLQVLLRAAERQRQCPVQLLLTCVVDPSPGVQTAALRALASLADAHAPLAEQICQPGSLSVVLSSVLRAATQLAQSPQAASTTAPSSSMPASAALASSAESKSTLPR
jgi:hypothetical protein